MAVGADVIATERVQRSYALGMFQSAPDAAYPAAGVQLCTNAWVLDDGSLQQRNGPYQVGAGSIGTAALGATVFRPTTGPTQWVGVDANGDVWVSVDQWSTLMNVGAAALTGGQMVSFATFAQGGAAYLLMVNGADLVSWDGTTLATVAAAPVGMTTIATFNERVYGAGHSGIVVQACAIGDHTDWAIPNGLALQIQTHDGDDDILRLLQVGNVLLVLKRRSTAYIDGFGQSDIIVAAGPRGASGSTGCIASRTAIALEGEAASWLSERGVEYWVPGSLIEPITTPVSEFLATIDRLLVEAASDVPLAIWIPQERAALYMLPTIDQGTDVLFVWRVKRPEIRQPAAISLFDIPRPASAEVGAGHVLDADGYSELEVGGGDNFTTSPDGYLEVADVGGLPLTTTEEFTQFLDPVLGIRDVFIADDGVLTYLDAAGEMFQEQRGESGAAGTSIPMRVFTRPEDFGAPNRRKRSRIARVLVDVDDPGAVTVRLRVDGVPKNAHVRSVSAGPRQMLKFRVNGRGFVHDLDITTNASFRGRLVASSIAAEPLLEPL